MKFIKKRQASIIIAAVCLVLELILSNWSALTLIFSGCDEKILDLSSAEIIDGTAYDYIAESYIYTNGGTVSISGVDTKIKNITVAYSSYGEYIPVTISFTDENFAYEDAYDYNSLYFEEYAETNHATTYHVSSYGQAGTIHLDYSGASGYVEIDSVSVNSMPSFGFSIVRFAVFLLVCFIVKKGLWHERFTETNRARALAICGAAMCVLVLYTAVALALNNADTVLLEEYPIADINSADEYEQLFDAFAKGQLNLDINYDTAALDSLDNTYDRSERNAQGVTGGFFDRAYYNGKFYSYFGVLPIFTVYFPIYIFTGKMPSTTLVSAILCVYAIIFITLLYNLIMSKLCKRTPAVLVVLGYFAVIFSSLVLTLAAENLFYFTAVLAGIGAVAAFFYFLLKAYYAETPSGRCLWLVFTGIAVVAIAAGRPTLLVYTLVAIVPAIYIFKGSGSVKQRALYIVSIGVPVVIGAALLMLYNYLRFDNPLEFGFNYQLTVSIADANTFTLSMLPAMLYHMFFQSPKVTGNFPYIEPKSYSLDSYSRYTYLGRNIGILNYPIMWGNVFLPFVSENKRNFKRQFCCAAFVCAVLLSFIDACKAGFHYRYSGDILLVFALIAVVAVCGLLALLEKTSYRLYKYAYGVAAAAMSASIVFGLLMVFAGENQTLIEKLPQAAYFVERMLSAG